MFGTCLLFACMAAAVAYPQQYQQQQVGIPPHLLRQYIAQAQQQRDATPIFEGDAQNAQGIAGTGGPPQQIRYGPVQRLVDRAQPQQQYVLQPQQQAQVQRYPAPAPAPAAAPRPRPSPLQGGQREQEDREDYDPNPSYQFGFDVNDDQYTNYQNRKEQREGDVIKGSYSVVDSDGFIRTVTYTADPKEGFKAEVSRQPTDIVVKIPTPKPQTEQQTFQRAQQPLQQAQQQAPQYYRYQ